VLWRLMFPRTDGPLRSAHLRDLSKSETVVYDVDKSDCLRHKSPKTFNSFDRLPAPSAHLRRPEDLSTFETVVYSNL